MPRRLIVLPLMLAFLALLALAQEPSRAAPESREQVTLSFAPVVKRAAPAVVNIYARRKVEVQGLTPLFEDPFFQRFFGESLGGMLGVPRERVVNSLGSGVIVQPEGLIVTNHHVVKGGDEIIVVLHDRREFAAKVALADPKTDLAFLRIDPKGEALPALPVGDSDTLEVGDLVIAIGNPFGVGQTVTSGIVSALARTTLGISDYQFFIQTDAAINPGNSGGALVTMAGELAGVNSAIYSRTGSNNGIGFAIPSTMVRAMMDSLASGGSVSRPWLGARGQAVTAEIAASLGLKKPVGVIVGDVYPGGPASAAGIKTGDVILSVDGKEVFDEESLTFRVATYATGKTAQFRVLREGREYTTEVRMAPPPEYPKRDARPLRGGHPLDGAVVANLSPALAEELGFDVNAKGVVIYELGRKGLAGRLGFERGDIILQINDVKVESTAQIEDALKAAKKASVWRIAYSRRGQVGTLVLAP